MAKQKNKYRDVDRLLLNLFHEPKTGLKELFEQRIQELDLSVNSALPIIGIEHRTLSGILDGTLKRIDLLALSRLAYFLQITRAEAVELMLDKLEKSYGEDLKKDEKKEFILLTFDLANLMKCGFISSISDFDHIEERINSYFGFESIFDYGQEIIDVAYSSGKHKPKNELTRSFWIESAAKNLKRINNYYEYDRAGLIDFIPSIRWHSMNIKNGLFQVIRELFKLGITVIYEPYMPTLHVRGATFSVNDKPCIVLTNYTDYYPSLWFALIHELHHVLFDWEEIRRNSYHISGELDLFTMKEVEADDFAREYLFSKKKMERVTPYIGNRTFVNEFAKANHIDPSIIYIFYCWDNKDSDKTVWARFTKFMPSYSQAVEALVVNPWQSRKPIAEIAKQRKQEVFNSI